MSCDTQEEGEAEEMSEDNGRIGISRRTFIELGGTALATCLLGGCSNADASSGNVATGKTTSGSLNGSGSSVSPKSSVEDYTWDELATISEEISASGSEDAAIKVAEKYNLCASDGTLDGTQTKPVKLSDGTQTSVQIAGFYHDDKSDGSGKAGITFIFKDAVAAQVMNTDDTNSGGWEACAMRSWLSSGFMDLLPSDLSKDIVNVDKLTNNVGATEDVSSVTVTQDVVWLFSCTELRGEIIQVSGGEYGEVKKDNEVLNAEGTEYQLFIECNAATDADSNAILEKTYAPNTPASGYPEQGEMCGWRLRSPSTDVDNDFGGVDAYGNVGYGGSGGHAMDTCGVVPGFCIGVSDGLAPVATATTATSASGSRQSIEDYTWDELATIADEISASGSEEAALQVAKKYNLFLYGKLDGTQIKSVELSDGTQTSVQIAGFYHDDKSDGSGKAGITFIFKDAVAEHEMNQSDDNTGGWEASEMRSWLASNFMSMLPPDLAKDIVTVDKLTNNTGETEDTSSVTTTQDAVWLFSPAELFGSIDWWSDDYSYGNDILNTEGTEYQLFIDSGVSRRYSGNGILTKNYQGENCYWWMRSASPNSPWTFRSIDSDGSPSYAGYPDLGESANRTNGVVPGFCI